MSPPRMIGQYRIAERLATGGAGEVYAGIDTKVGREVALKFLRPELASDPNWVDRFLAEAKSLGRLNHPNIATLYALPQEGDHVCMIMELVRGRTIEQIIEERRGGLGTRESLAILAQVADGLSYAHEKGVIHRDIKPSNLMVTESGRVKIMDFGIARVRGSDRLTRVGSAVGTALYMSPEQFDGLEGDERSDIYSLAIVLYELLASAPPFKGTNEFELSRAHRGTQPPPLIPRIAGVEPPLESAIMTALSKRPEQRFPSMRSFSDAIGATTLRGEATGIINNWARAVQGQGSAREPPKRAPFHTVAVALMRSRGATIMRRFKGLHPAVQGVSVGVLAMAIVAAVLLRPEPGPVPPNPVPGPPQSLDERPPGTSSPFPRNGQVNPPPPSARSASENQKSPKQPCNGGFVSTTEGDCVRFDPAGEQRQMGEQNRTPQMEASKNQEGNKPAPADFQTAYDRENYGAALDIAQKLDDAGKPAGAYGLGLLYYHGYGVKKDTAKAKTFFARAAQDDYPIAMVKLGAMYYKGEGGGRKDPINARIWFQRAAKSGDDEAKGQAMKALGSMCEQHDAGLSPPCDAEELVR
jgi:serine/threonine protein kinase